MSELHIRDARAGDQEVIRDVTISAYQEYGLILPALWDVYRQDILATLANINPAEQIVAEQEGTVIGTVLLYPRGTVLTAPDGEPFTLTWPEVRLLAVAPEARGQGFGAALVRECLRRAQQSGASALTLHTLDMMQTAMRMYERMGFVRVPELDFLPAPDLTVKSYRYRFDDGV